MKWLHAVKCWSNPADPPIVKHLDAEKANEKTFYLGETDSQHVWLIYRNNVDWLKSPDAALTLSFARNIAKAKPDKSHLVFAPSRFVS